MIAEQQRLGHVAERLDHDLGVAAEHELCSPAPSFDALAAACAQACRPCRAAGCRGWRPPSPARDRSRRLISAGEVARVKRHQVGQRHERRARRRRAPRAFRSPTWRDVAAQRLRQAHAHVDRLALLVLVGRDRLPADQHADRVGHGAAAEARDGAPARGRRSAGTRAGPAPAPPRCRRCPAPCTARASARAAYFFSVAMSSPWTSTCSGFWNASGILLDRQDDARAPARGAAARRG